MSASRIPLCFVSDGCTGVEGAVDSLLVADIRIYATAPSREEREENPAQELAKHTIAVEALGVYCSALSGLWPWTASGLIMTPEVAFNSGLAQL